MPLKSGNSDETIGRNVREMMRAYKRKGKIGNTSPRDEQHARKIALAAAHDKAGKSRKK